MAGFRAWLRELLMDRLGPDPAPGSSLPQAPTELSGPGSFAENSNNFALAMSRQMRQQREPGNLFFSPFSIRTALAMAYAGARGETAAQMAGALRVGSSGETLHETFGQIIQRLNATASGKYEMAVASSLWGQEGALPESGFLDLAARYYGGGMNVADFRRDAEAARLKINQWVDEKTRRKIRELIPSGGLDADTRLILVNAIYFKGLWMLPFRKANTLEQPFYAQRGRTVKAQLMFQQPAVRYVKAHGFQAVDLEYQGGDLSLLVLLPNKKYGLQDIEARLSTRMLHDCVARMVLHEVRLFLPRFRVTLAVELGQQLRALGMPLAFDGSRPTSPASPVTSPPTRIRCSFRRSSTRLLSK